MNRRQFLRSSLLSSLAISLPTISLAQSELTIRFRQAHTAERYEGPVDQASYGHICNLLRDHRSGEEFPIDMRLLEALATLQLQNAPDAGDVVIFSAFRSAKTNAMLRQQDKKVAKKSHHMLGQAVVLCIWMWGMCVTGKGRSKNKHKMVILHVYLR